MGKIILILFGCQSSEHQMANRCNVFYYSRLCKKSKKFVKKYGEDLQQSFVIVECIDDLVASTGQVPKRYYAIRKMTLPVFQYYNPEEDTLEYHYAGDSFTFAKHYLEQVNADPTEEEEDSQPDRRLTMDELAELRTKSTNSNPFAEPFKTEDLGSGKLTKEEMDRQIQQASGGRIAAARENPEPEPEPMPSKIGAFQQNNKFSGARRK